MAVCSVLRCTEQALRVVRMAPPEVGTFTTAVCDEHKQAIDAGAEWTYDTIDQVIYMSADLTAAEHLVVRSIRLSQLEKLMPDLGEIPIVADLTCKPRGSRDWQTVSLVFTEDMATALIDAFVRLIPPDRLLGLLKYRHD